MVQAHRYGLTHLECLSEAFLCRQAYVLHCEYHREQQQRRLRERPLDRGVDSMEVDGAVVDEDGGDEEEEEEEDPIVSLVSCRTVRSVPSQYTHRLNIFQQKLLTYPLTVPLPNP